MNFQINDESHIESDIKEMAQPRMGIGGLSLLSLLGISPESVYQFSPWNAFPDKLLSGSTRDLQYFSCFSIFSHFFKGRQRT